MTQGKILNSDFLRKILSVKIKMIMGIFTFEQRAKNNEVWHWAWDRDTDGETREDFIESLSKGIGSEFCELLIEVSWLPPAWQSIHIDSC